MKARCRRRPKRCQLHRQCSIHLGELQAGGFDNVETRPAENISTKLASVSCGLHTSENVRGGQRGRCKTGEAHRRW